MTIRTFSVISALQMIELQIINNGNERLMIVILAW
jgi:hypothetical protein